MTQPKILWTPSHAHAEQNCACPTVSPLPVPAAILNQPSQLWHHPSALYHDTLPDDHSLLYNPMGSAGVVVLNEAARSIWSTFAHPQPLTNDVSYQLARLNLLYPTNQPPQLPAETPNTLTAWLHVTNACNLRCHYCYVQKTNESMDEHTGRAAIDTLFRTAQQHGFRAIKLKYAGGEATLNFALVQTLHQYAIDLAHQTSLQIQGAVLSNGVALSPAMLAFIQQQHLHLMISLDGLGQAHDQQRPFANGRGSANLVVRSIERAIAHHVAPSLSITITGQNTTGVLEAVDLALQHNLLFNLNFYRNHHARVDNWRAADDQLITAMQAVFRQIEAVLPAQSLLGTIIDRATFGGPHRYVCGAGRDYMVIDQRGNIAACQMALEQPITDVFASDPLQYIRLQSGPVQNVPVEEKEGCRTCQWRYWCAGGCPMLTKRVTGRTDVKSPYCHVYQALYPELLRLEGLRLLKWSG